MRGKLGHGLLGHFSFPRVTLFYLVLFIFTPIEFSVFWLSLAIVLDIVGMVI
ncbi:hypothetical protein JXB11_05145 [Candidatus Woesearchaeota archaeon]|nr:hypothetical protein [Candidatus Woesearchaeota archaeon]